MRRLLPFVLSLLLPLPVFGQLLQPVYSAPSPQAASLGEYGEVPAERRTSQLVSPDFGLGEVIEVEDGDDAEPGGGPRSISLIQTRLDNPYRFGGKERLDAGALNLYDFGARHFTSVLPRWLTMDL